MHVNILVHNNKTVRLPPESLLCLSDIYGSEMPICNSTILIKNIWAEVLPPANEVCEGYVFTRVCLSTGGVVSQHALQVSSPHPGGKLRGLAWGGISRPTPRGVSRSTPRGVYPSMHWGRRPPPTATAAGGTHPSGMHSCHHSFCSSLLPNYGTKLFWMVGVTIVLGH